MFETANIDYAADYDADYERPIIADIFSEKFLITLRNSYFSPKKFL